MESDVQRPMLTRADMAKRLRVSTTQVSRLVHAGRIPRPIELGKLFRWDADDVEAWSKAGGPTHDEWEAMKQQANGLAVAG